MQLVIFDVQVNGALLPPEEFINKFKDFNIARVVFEGKYSGQLFNDVRTGRYNVKEGVVVKGVFKGQIRMAKIKTRKYLGRLKERFGDSWQEYWE